MYQIKQLHVSLIYTNVYQVQLFTYIYIYNAISNIFKLNFLIS